MNANEEATRGKAFILKAARKLEFESGVNGFVVNMVAEILLGTRMPGWQTKSSFRTAHELRT